MAERLMDAGADLVSLSEKIDTTTAAGKMVFRMLAVLNEFERDQISERTRTVMGHKKSKGERVGSIPYGFTLAKDKKTLMPDQKEQDVIRFVLDYHAAGIGLRPTARALKERGVLTRQRKEFAPVQIQRIVDANSPAGDTQVKAVCG
jgi:DNA invertase Pin-like site-specific DNA recombinase